MLVDAPENELDILSIPLRGIGYHRYGKRNNAAVGLHEKDAL